MTVAIDIDHRWWPLVVTERGCAQGESEQVEYKSGSILEEGKLLPKLVRECLAMANNEDGGVVVVGVEEHDGKFEPVGLRPDELHRVRPDQLERDLIGCGYPRFNVQASIREHQGHKYLYMVVEGADCPVISTCSHGPRGDDDVREGVVYVRRGTSSQAAGAAEYERLLKRHKEGIRVGAMRELRVSGWVDKMPPPKTDAEQFEQEAGDIS